MSFRKRFGLFAILLFFSLITFQNCSRVNFAASGSYEPDPEIPLYRAGEMYAEKIDMAAKGSDQNPIEFIFYIDASYSNIKNVDGILNGLKKFFDDLPKGPIEIKIYYIGLPKDYIIGPTIEKRTVINSVVTHFETERKVLPPSSQVARTSTTPDTEFKADLDKMYASISSFLKSIPTMQTDSYPSIKPELVALLAERKNQGSQKRMVNIIVTDEDTHPSESGCVHQYMMFDEVKVYAPVSYSIIFPASHLVKLEGDGGYRTEVVGFTGQGFTECTDANIGAALAQSSGYSRTEDSLKQCQTRQSGGGLTSTQIAANSMKVKRFGDNDFRTEAACVTNYAQHIKDLISSENQPQTFFGLFTIMNAADKTSQDQELSVEMSKFFSSAVPQENIKQQSIVRPDFAKFETDVIEFKNRTENNRIYVGDLIARIPKGFVIQVKKVFATMKDSGKRIEIQKYNLVGTFLIANDIGLDLSPGAEIDLEFSIVR